MDDALPTSVILSTVSDVDALSTPTSYNDSVLEALLHDWKCTPVCPDCCCAPIPNPTVTRIVLLIMASVVALFGVLTNVVLLYVYIRPRVSFTVNPLYLVELALCDVALCGVYVMIFVVAPVSTFFAWYPGYWLSWKVTVPGWAMSAMVQLAIPVLLVYASYERWILVSQSGTAFLRHLVTRRMRWLISGVSMVIIFLLRYPLIYSYSLAETNCSDKMRSFYMEGPHDDVVAWYTIYDVVYIFCHALIPFFVLSSLNGLIVYRLRTTTTERRKSLYDAGADLTALFSSMMPGMGGQVKRQLRDDKVRLRSAIYTMAVIISTHLLCNSIHLIIKCMEIFKFDILFEDGTNNTVWSTFYINLSDLITFLFTACSAIRVPIYYFCNVEIKRELNWFFMSWSKTIQLIWRGSATAAADSTTVNGRTLIKDTNGYKCSNNRAQKKRFPSLTNGDTGETPLVPTTAEATMSTTMIRRPACINGGQQRQNSEGSASHQRTVTFATAVTVDGCPASDTVMPMRHVDSFIVSPNSTASTTPAAEHTNNNNAKGGDNLIYDHTTSCYVHSNLQQTSCFQPLEQVTTSTSPVPQQAEYIVRPYQHLESLTVAESGDDESVTLTNGTTVIVNEAALSTPPYSWVMTL